MELSGKVALVTGGARGIGGAVSRACAGAGAAVAVVDRDIAAGEALIAELVAQGAQARLIVADVGSSVDARRIAQEAVAAFGGIDCLVNNAGIQTYGTVETMDEADWDLTLTVNLKSVFLVSKYVVPELRRRGGGSIVNIASVQGLATEANVSAYAASKGGMLAMSRSMALDYAAEQIRVNCVCPGSVDTPMLRNTADHVAGGDADAAIAEWGRLHPLGRVARPEEVAELVLFLAGPRSSFCTGGAYLVDGGLMAAF